MPALTPLPAPPKGIASAAGASRTWNILPFPPLDGGRMLMLMLKAIPRYGKRISLRAEQLTYAIGFVALFTFLIWITVFDVARQFGGGTP